MPNRQHLHAAAVQFYMNTYQQVYAVEFSLPIVKPNRYLSEKECRPWERAMFRLQIGNKKETFPFVLVPLIAAPLC